MLVSHSHFLSEKYQKMSILLLYSGGRDICIIPGVTIFNPLALPLVLHLIPIVEIPLGGEGGMDVSSKSRLAGKFPHPLPSAHMRTIDARGALTQWCAGGEHTMWPVAGGGGGSMLASTIAAAPQLLGGGGGQI